MVDRRWWLLLAALPACSAGDRGGEVVGGVTQSFLQGWFIGDVEVDPVTVHSTDPRYLLTSSEGAGPRTLNVAVSAAVAPQITITGTRTPPHAELSQALGYDVTQTIQLTSDSSVLVPLYAYARVDAYPTFQRTTWALIEMGGVVVGAGSVLKPIGVFFDTCGCIGPDPCGVGCVSGFPYGSGPPPDPAGPSSSAPADSDAGTGDGGTGDGG